MQRIHFETEHNLFRDAFAAFLAKEVVPHQEAWEEAGVVDRSVWLKAGEYLHLAQRGLDLEHSTFFTLFWLVTGFHFLHVWLGLVILGWMALRCLRGAYAEGALGGLESGALYWHMVDLVWVMLFPLVYVLAPLP